MSDLLVIVLFAALGYYFYSHKRLKARYGEALAAYNSGAFNEIIEPSPDERFVCVTRLGREVESNKGVKAILMAAQGRGIALHQINKNGTFSTKGPYFVSWYSRNWRLTGATHLVKVLRGKGWGFPPDHYHQNGRITEKGVSVLEYNTSRYRPLGLSEFAERVERQINP
jgi:hypothetical protein